MARKQKKTKKKVTKKPPRRLSGVTLRRLSGARVKMLALQCETLTEADAALGGKRPLAQILAGSARLQGAWGRGRFLRDLKDVVETTVISVTQIEEKLGLAGGELSEMLKSDPEVADIFNSGRLGITIKVNEAIVKHAIAGKSAAITKIINILLSETAGKTTVINWRAVTITQMVELTGVTRQTLDKWYKKHGLSRNTDTTFDLRVFIRWFEAFTVGKVRGAGGAARVGTAGPVSELSKLKAKVLARGIAVEDGNLLERAGVIAGLVARVQGLKNVLEKLDNVAQACYGQPVTKITEILKIRDEEILRAQCRVPDELRLAAGPAKRFAKLLASLEAEGSSA